MVVKLAGFHPLHQAAAGMGAHVPVIHQGKLFIGLVYGDHRPFRENVQIGVGDQRSDLDNAIAFRIQAGHLQIDPNQVIFVSCHDISCVKAKR